MSSHMYPFMPQSDPQLFLRIQNFSVRVWYGVVIVVFPYPTSKR